jgi:hypothetical protein
MSQVINKQFDGDRKAIFVMNFKIASTTAESYEIVCANLNTNIAGAACTSLVINKVWWSVNNTAVTKPLSIYWEASADDLAITCNYADSKDFSAIGGLLNPESSGYSGDIKVEFESVTDDDTATLVLELLKSY